MVPGYRVLKFDLTWLGKGTLASEYTRYKTYFIDLVALRCETAANFGRGIEPLQKHSKVIASERQNNAPA
jgi:hypothetical protein